MKNFLLSTTLLFVSLFALTGCFDEDDVTPEANCFTTYTEYITKLSDQSADLCAVSTEYFTFLEENKSCIAENSNGTLTEADIDLVLLTKDIQTALYCN
ncbi:hypothetical protein [Flammeovirga sp. EKP202]|uniref:hypothetical protein n=1 Tax=Flammeovirga sp. EKP202 TaxID=2770592 RepID=UPI00165F278A|nr:hypothetical protein [Flammeovirga sp. EKP202]MBD0403350.1 hypothetical protein [Flammeovirga sp. EKP202]